MSNYNYIFFTQSQYLAAFDTLFRCARKQQHQKIKNNNNVAFSAELDVCATDLEEALDPVVCEGLDEPVHLRRTVTQSSLRVLVRRLQRFFSLKRLQQDTVRN